MVSTKLPFGELALLEDLVTRDQLLPLLRRQNERRVASRPVRKIGTLLVHEGLISKKEAKRLLALQKGEGPIAGYKLLERLGSGGMGTVYRAVQRSLGREVALKVLARGASRNERYRARFLQEAKLLAELSHPNLIKAYEFGESNDHLYFAMEYVRGRTLRDALTRYGSIPEPEALDYMEQVARAIEHYGARKVVHRDVKPENILITERGVAKLADLGLSKRLTESGDLGITRPGKTLGTPLYISPELALGADEIDVRSDLYSLGATFYHVIAGAPPFERESGAELLTAHARERPRPAREANPIVTSGTEEVLARLLEKNPEDRIQSPAELIAAIVRVRRGESPFGAVGSSSGTRRKRKAATGRQDGSSSAARRSPLAAGPRRAAAPGWLAGAALLVLALAGIGGIFASYALGGVRERVPASANDPELALDEIARAGLEPVDELARLDALARRIEKGLPLQERIESRRERARERLEADAAACLEDARAAALSLADAGKVEEAQARLDGFPERYRGTRAFAQRDEVRREIAR